MKSIFKSIKSTVKQKQGMTLVETLVAMALIMLIIFTFTPLFLQNFKNIRTAGEVTKSSYEKASLLEQSEVIKEDLPTLLLPTKRMWESPSLGASLKDGADKTYLALWKLSFMRSP